MNDPFIDALKDIFSDREIALIRNCQSYAKNKPSGLPGHNLMMIINKLMDLGGGSYNCLDDEKKDLVRDVVKQIHP